MSTMSPEGLNRLILREGKRLTAYKDTKGIWTIGVGHTSAAGLPKVVPGLTITNAQCAEIFARDIKQYEDAVAKAIKVTLSVNERDALISLCFNIGTGGFSGSTLVKRINARSSKADIKTAFLMWNKPVEIQGRRKSEVDQFFTADPQGSPQTATKPSVGTIPPKAPLPSPEAPKATERPTGLFNLIIDRLKAAYPPKA